MNNLWSRFATSTIALLVAISVQAQTDSKAFQDPLDTPAVEQFGFRGRTSQPLMAITNAGTRVVAVGLRGLIIISDDQGRSWHQARVPVQTDLVAVQFVSPEQGWATGHDAVILHTEDGGRTWKKQLDNRVAAVAFPAYYRNRIASGDASAAVFLKEIELNTQGDTSLPFLSVHFTDLQHGIAVGSFGMIVSTDDGGKHWIPWMDHIDNKGFLNLNVIKKIGDNLVIAGEQGGVYRYDGARRSFVAVSAPYKGSFFDVTGTGNFLLAVGLRGTVFRSPDGGATWQHVDTPVKDSFTTAATVDGGAMVILGSSGGALLVSRDQGVTFQAEAVSHPMPFTGIDVLGAQRLMLAGLQGVNLEQVLTGRSATFNEVSK
ncbi:WD40/YVTN/BNR-like repeat-containing protein [Paraburkholderia sp. GAS32]|uniref:WD40/YVTN/BNR-like repeat-containing protein n=1 Tax=Paraburkholderia sp. GAS32 TaxID=3035129 RepID=UPI003D1B460A